MAMARWVEKQTRSKAPFKSHHWSRPQGIPGPSTAFFLFSVMVARGPVDLSISLTDR